MSRRDFVAIAAAIHEELDRATEAASFAARQALLGVAIAVAKHAKEVNPNFKKDRFMRACGFPELADN